VCLDELWLREKECGVCDRLTEESEPLNSRLEKDIALLLFIFLSATPEKPNPLLPAPETVECLFRFRFAALKVTVARSITPAAIGRAEDACIVVYNVCQKKALRSRNSDYIAAQVSLSPGNLGWRNCP